MAAETRRVQENFRKNRARQAARLKKAQGVLSAAQAASGAAIQGMGQSTLDTLGRSTAGVMGNVRQNLVNRGLSTASNMPKDMSEAAYQQAGVAGRVMAPLAGQLAASNAGLAQAQSGLLERVTDQPPDLSRLLALYQQYGASGQGRGFRGLGGGMEPQYANGGIQVPLGLQNPMAAWAMMQGGGRGGGRGRMDPQAMQQMMQMQALQNQGVEMNPQMMALYGMQGGQQQGGGRPPRRGRRFPRQPFSGQVRHPSANTARADIRRAFGG
jgi:hypothetical protein